MVKCTKGILLSLLLICFLSPTVYGQDEESIVHFDVQIGLYFGYSSIGIDTFMLGIDVDSLTRLYGLFQLSPLAFGLGSIGIVNQWLIESFILEHSLIWFGNDTKFLATYNLGAGVCITIDELQRAPTINITAGATLVETGNALQEQPYFDPVRWYVRATLGIPRGNSK